MRSKFLPFLILIRASFATPLNQSCTPAAPIQNCLDLFIPIQASANITEFPTYPNSTNPSEIYQYLESLGSSNVTFPEKPISGTWNMSVRYCEPTVEVESRKDTIQFLLHGFAYTKTYWDGVNYPFPTFSGQYSYTSHANSQGYSTLSIDNLGNGLSEHPDPMLVQFPLQLAILHAVILSLKSGSLPSIPSFKNVIFTTHSYGSIIGHAMATLFPDNAADAYVLTATSNNLTGINNAIGVFQLKTAALVDPTKYGDLNRGYLTISAEGLRDSVYGLPDTFSPDLLLYDQENGSHTIALGELASISPYTAISNFTGPVFVLTGRDDQIVCGEGNITQSVGICGTGPDGNPAGTKVLYPKAEFGYYVPAGVGHDINLHYEAGESFGAVHAWLESVGF